MTDKRALFYLARVYLFVMALTGVTVGLSAFVASTGSVLIAALFLAVWFPVIIGCIFVYAVFEMDGRIQ